MSDQDFLNIANKVFRAIFARDNDLNLDELRKKFAFDIKLPTAVETTLSKRPTWTAMPNAKKYMTVDETDDYDNDKGWMLEKRDFKSLSEILEAWDSINYTSTERVYNSENVVASDPIYNSNNVYASTNCGGCKNMLFCDGTYDLSLIHISEPTRLL